MSTETDTGNAAEPTPTPLPPILQLHVPNTPISEGAIQVQWCLTRAGRQALTNQGISDPYLLLVVVPKDDHSIETRQIAKLSDGMTYLSFARPGEHSICAMIIWPDKASPSPADLRSNFLSNSRRWRYYSTVLDHGCERFLNFVTDRFNLGSFNHTALAHVEIPQGTFAKPPRDLEWVNLWFGNRPLEDQCSLRRRRIIAYTIQPPAMLVLALFIGAFAGLVVLTRALVALCGFLAGIRAIEYRTILHPFDNETNQLIESMDIDSSIFVPVLNHRPLYFTLPLTPAFAGIFFFIIKIIPIHEQPNVWRSYSNALFWTVIASLLLSAIFGLIQTLVNLPAIVRALQRLEFALTKSGEMQDEVDALVCTDGNIPHTARPKTIRLAFLATKAKVCRPFAQ